MSNAKPETQEPIKPAYPRGGVPEEEAEGGVPEEEAEGEERKSAEQAEQQEEEEEEETERGEQEKGEEGERADDETIRIAAGQRPPADS